MAAAMKEVVGAAAGFAAFSHRERARPRPVYGAPRPDDAGRSGQARAPAPRTPGSRSTRASCRRSRRRGRVARNVVSPPSKPSIGRPEEAAAKKLARAGRRSRREARAKKAAPRSPPPRSPRRKPQPRSPPRRSPSEEEVTRRSARCDESAPLGALSVVSSLPPRRCRASPAETRSRSRARSSRSTRGIRRSSPGGPGEGAAAECLGGRARRTGDSRSTCSRPRPAARTSSRGSAAAWAVAPSCSTATSTPSASRGCRTSPGRTRNATGRLYGRGSADMKGGIAAMCAAAARAADAGLGGEVIIAAVIDEEFESHGTRHLHRERRHRARGDRHRAHAPRDRPRASRLRLGSTSWSPDAPRTARSYDIGVDAITGMAHLLAELDSCHRETLVPPHASAARPRFAARGRDRRRERDLHLSRPVHGEPRATHAARRARRRLPTRGGDSDRTRPVALPSTSTRRSRSASRRSRTMSRVDHPIVRRARAMRSRRGSGTATDRGHLLLDRRRPPLRRRDPRALLRPRRHRTRARRRGVRSAGRGAARHRRPHRRDHAPGPDRRVRRGAVDGGTVRRTRTRHRGRAAASGSSGAARSTSSSRSGSSCATARRRSSRGIRPRGAGIELLLDETDGFEVVR